MFEPNANLLSDFEKKIKNFRSDWTIVVNNRIVSSTDGYQTINFTKDDVVSSVLNVGTLLNKSNPETYDIIQRAEMQSIKLDSYHKHFISSCASIDILKTDTQGNDLDVLVGAKDLLRKNMISFNRS